jgi:hypothetical protein
MHIVKSHFCQGTPPGAIVKEKGCGIVSDEPVFAEPYRACYHGTACMEDAANAERILGLVFRAVWHFVVEGTQTPRPVPIGLGRLIGQEMAKDLCERLYRFSHSQSQLIAFRWRGSY